MELICFHWIAARGLETVENTKSYGGKVRLRLKDYTITKQGPKFHVAAATAALVGAGALWWLGLDLA